MVFFRVLSKRLRKDMNASDDYKRKSIGIYSMPNDEYEQCSPLEVHINLWCIKSKKQNAYALDFGIKFKLDTKEILLLIPKIIDYKNVFDIGQRLIDNSRLLCSVFNENYQIVKNPTGSLDIVNDITGKTLFGIYKLRMNASISVKINEVNSTYTEIRITPQCKYEQLKSEVDSLYVRFQIKLKDLKPFATDVAISNDFLQSAFSSSHLFDIRINDKREIDSNVDEKLVHDKWKQAQFSKLHFFYMSEVSETVDNGSKLHLDTRMLEENLWKKYFGDTNVIEGQHIAYHWKKTVKEQRYEVEFQDKRICLKPKYENQSFDSFTLFFKTTYSNLNIIRILKYSGIIIFLGILSSLFFLIFTSILTIFHLDKLLFLLCVLVVLVIILVQFIIHS